MLGLSLGIQPIRRAVVALVNLISNSRNRTAGSWVGSNFTAVNATTVTLTSGYQVGSYTAGSAGLTFTQGIILSGTPGQMVNIYLQDNGGAYAATVVPITLTATPTMYRVVRNVSVSSVLCGISSPGATVTVTVGGTGLFLGDVPLATLQATGIPTT